MKCPYCKYVDGWNNLILDNIKGLLGEFRKLSNNIVMVKPGHLSYSIYGCPKCKMLFMDL